MRVLFVVAVLASLAIAAPAHAATFVVTKKGDSLDFVCNADCSLRDAVTAANADPAADEIVLPAGVLRLSLLMVENTNIAGDLDVTSDLTIRGAGAAATTIQSAAGDRVLDLHGAAADLRLLDLTVTGGRALAPNDFGGGIRSQGTGELSLERVVVRDNFSQGAASNGHGGGIYKGAGRLVVRDSAIVGNQALSSGFGGGIFLNALGTSAELTNVTIAENYAGSSGGGIYSNHAIPAALVHVTVAGNEAGSSNGGIDGDAASFRLRSSIVAANAAPANPDCGPSFAPLSDGGNVGPPACGLTQSSDAQTGDPALGPLSATAIPVREPLAGSPALDRAVGPCPAADARGLPRPQGAACDAGAAELAVLPAAVPAAGVSPAPRLLALPRKLRLKGGKIAVPLRCAAGARCTGSLKLTAAARRGRASAQAVVVLGRRAFAIPGGKRATVRAPLSAAGRRAIRGRKGIRATLTVRLTGASRAQTAKVRIARRSQRPRGTTS